MRMRCANVLLQVVLAWAVLASSATSHGAPPPAEVRRQVEDALQDLGANARAVRRAAEQRLFHLGPDALEYLPPADLIESAAVRDSVRRIRRTLELTAAEESVLPTRATLIGDKSLREHTNDLERQTGNRVMIAADVPAQHLSLELTDQTFWNCVSAICTAANLRWEFDASRSIRIGLGAAPVGIAAASDSAYRVTLDAVTFRNRIARLEFGVVAEPRLRPLFLRIADADFHVSTDGQAWELLSPAAKTERPITNAGRASFAVLFRPPSDPAATSIDVEGRITAETAARPTEFRFQDPDADLPIERRRGGVTVRLEAFRLLTTQRAAEFELSVLYESGGRAFESHRTWVFGNECFLEGPEGTRFAVERTYQTLRQGDGELSLRYRVSNLPDPLPGDLAVVYIAPTLVIDVPVEFSWKSVSVSE